MIYVKFHQSNLTRQSGAVRMAIENKKLSAQPQKTLTNRTFGLIFAGIFLVFTLFPLIKGNAINQWTGYLSAAFAVLAILVPIALTPFNKLFQLFGQVMHKITNPLIMGLVFFLTVLPTGLILKILGKDPMRRKLDPSAESYWIKREAGSITKESFDNQF